MADIEEFLSSDEREEWAKLLSDALNGSRTVDDAAMQRAERYLADAEQAHRPWVRIVVRSFIIAGLRNALTRLAKRESVVLMAYNGQPVATTTRIGTKQRRPDGRVEHQISALSVVTWAQLEEWLDMIEQQLAAGLVNQEKGRRLLALRERFPDSIGPGEACGRLGLTIAEYLEDDPAGTETG